MIIRYPSPKSIPQRNKDHLFGKPCAVCGGTKSLQYDHIIPRWKGGTNDANNIQVLCSNCHDEKSRKEFALRRFNPRDSKKKREEIRTKVRAGFEPFWNLNEVGDYFKVKPDTVKKWYTKGNFPYPVNFESELRWRKTDIMRYIEMRSEEATAWFAERFAERDRKLHGFTNGDGI